MPRWPSATPSKRTPMDDRFWSKVDKSGECWLWTGGKTPKGYGVIRTPGKAGRLIASHRVSYEIANGPIPPGFMIDHICHNRACVRPEHLRLATNKQNMENPSGLIGSNKSGHRGVSWHVAAQKWESKVHHNGHSIYLGLFTSRDEAARAATAKRNELFTHNLADRRNAS